jgi:hypothetical protein
MKKRKKKDEKDDKNLLFDFQFHPSPALQKTVPPGKGGGEKMGHHFELGSP